MTDLVVIVTGSRDWVDREPIHHALDKAFDQLGRALVVFEGGARGADRIAHQWAMRRRAGNVHMPADWGTHHPDWCPPWCSPVAHYCKGAGPRRNQQMLDAALERSDVIRVLAFKQGFDLKKKSGGTEDMVRRAELAQAQVDVWLHNGRSWSLISALEPEMRLFDG